MTIDFSQVAGTRVEKGLVAFQAMLDAEAQNELTPDPKLEPEDFEQNER